MNYYNFLNTNVTCNDKFDTFRKTVNHIRKWLKTTFPQLTFKVSSKEATENVYVCWIDCPFHDEDREVRLAFIGYIENYIRSIDCVNYQYVSIENVVEPNQEAQEISNNYHANKTKAFEDEYKIKKETEQAIINEMAEMGTIFIKDLDQSSFIYNDIWYDIYVDMDNNKVTAYRSDANVGEELDTVVLPPHIFMEKEYEYRERVAKENKQKICEHVTITDTDEYYCDTVSSWRSKANNLSEYKEVFDNPEEIRRIDSRVTKDVNFENEYLYNTFCNMLLDDFDFIAGTGGSSTDDERINSMQDYNRMTSEERATVKWYSDDCIMISLYGLPKFIIDAQGYSYARYVHFLDINTYIKKL